MKRPAFQFYPADWRKDPALSACSLAARGLWIELMCIAHEGGTYGVLSINGRPMAPAQIARMVGESPASIVRLLTELEDAGVFSRDEQGCIFSRRMVKDEHVRNVRADAGRLGGNPNLLKQSSKQKGNLDPPPSSSSSSSSSSSEKRDAGEPAAPAKPSRSSRADKTLKTYIDECRAAGVKPIPDDHPVRRYCESAGITPDMAALAWLRFREEHTIGTRKAKRYTDWPATFANSVKDRWYKFWIANTEGDATWTSEGLQARRVVDAQRHPEPEAA